MATYDLAYPGAAIDAILNTAYFLQEAGYIFQGSASEYSGTPSKRVWLIAPAGFTGLGLSSAVPQGSFGICLYNGTAWVGKVINVLTLDSEPTRNSQNGVTSGGVAATLDEIAGGIMETFASLLFDDETASADLRTKLSYAVKFSVSDVYQTVTHLNILAATASKAGLMSAEDKAKVDSFLTNLRSLTFTDTTASADQGTKITETLKATIGGVQEVIDSITLLAATSSKAGLLSASDKAYIDALPATITNLSNSISGALALMQSLVGYYVCDTAAGTAAKTVAASGYSLTNGGCIRIKMNNANTAANVTLNINSTGAKALYYDGAQASSTNTWEAGEVLEVYYDGTQYQCASGGGGKFATGEKVLETSITNQVTENSTALVTSGGVAGVVKTIYNRIGMYIQPYKMIQHAEASATPSTSGNRFSLLFNVVPGYNVNIKCTLSPGVFCEIWENEYKALTAGDSRALQQFSTAYTTNTISGTTNVSGVLRIGAKKSNNSAFTQQDIENLLNSLTYEIMSDDSIQAQLTNIAEKVNRTTPLINGLVSYIAGTYRGTYSSTGDDLGFITDEDYGISIAIPVNRGDTVEWNWGNVPYRTFSLYYTDENGNFLNTYNNNTETGNRVITNFGSLYTRYDKFLAYASLKLSEIKDSYVKVNGVMVWLPVDNDTIKLWYAASNPKELQVATFNSSFNEENTYSIRKKYCSLIRGKNEIETFLLFSDPHLTDYNRYEGPYIPNTRYHYTTEEIRAKYISMMQKYYNSLPMDTCICCGDWINAENTYDAACEELGYQDGYMRKLFKNYFPVLGNHDPNPYNWSGGGSGAHQLSLTDVRNLMFRENGNQYYAFKRLHTNFYVLDTGISATSTMTSYRWEQVDWFANKLLEENPVHGIILSHIFSNGDETTRADWYTHYHQMPQRILEIAIAFNNRTSITLNSRTYDFSGSTGKIFAYIVGHCHYDIVDNTHEIPVVAITNIQGGYWIDNVQGTEHAYTLTPTFDNCIADYEHNKLFMVRVGAQVSRVVNVVPSQISVGGTIQLTPTIDGTYTWYSEKSSVVSVANGTVTGVASGIGGIRAIQENGDEEYWIINVT